MQIKTNNHWRNLLYWYELTEQEQAGLDYADKCGDFLRYKGRAYSIEDFMLVDEHNELFKDWHGYASDSFFSGVLIRCDEYGERYQIATYFA